VRPLAYIPNTSKAHTAMARAASAVMVATRARITSSYGMGTPARPRAWCCKSRSMGVQWNLKEARGTQVNFPFSSN
jgi:hypothetical protein